jgi:hypothetical protein
MEELFQQLRSDGMCTHTMVAQVNKLAEPDRYACCDCIRYVVPKRGGGFKLAPKDKHNEQ